MKMSNFYKDCFSTEIRCLLEDEISELKRYIRHNKPTSDYILKQALYYNQILKFMRENPSLFTRINNKFKKEV